ncbi:lysis protein [Yersinia aleksiciae]|uniref:Putative prophage endopeptidase n=1 Tax=Yersinia aleksiciae TaxID=263819 RepID=A0A0T9UVZ4_YERAE|nr:lysis protein [Yersinia aleksiciae]MDA5496824.1 lysis protein [Yersinia aleksiciae]NIK98793.1 lysis protein [Yersinia aleksiciae]WQC72299.1 lysis protein [Yersinia aleksiciae]CFQ33501.1 putative prophage endopeptidase [Yersinia aleksiciae]CNL76660.1 putative prophage endopeptidase [Yersinia aleksiciae]
MNKIIILIIAALVALICLLAFNSYRFSNEAEKQGAMMKVVTAERNAALDNILLMEKQRQAVADIDIKYTKELADAKSENERLRTDINNGTKRLQFNATCQRTYKKSSSSGMDDAASPRLTDSAQRDYLNLRERIGIATNQIAGLQAYITDVCLAK